MGTGFQVSTARVGNHNNEWRSNKMLARADSERAAESSLADMSSHRDTDTQHQMERVASIVQFVKENNKIWEWEQGVFLLF